MAGKQQRQRCTPVHYFSHGTPSMLGEESKSADYWEHCGNLALRHGVKHIIIMVSSIQAESATSLTPSREHTGLH